MNRSDLIDKIAKGTGGTKVSATQALDIVFAELGRTMAEGGEVRISGFGTFTSKNRPDRTGRNPKTGAALKIAAKKIPVFRPASALKDSIANGK
jgi:DNA-binding protein HU-beta